MALTPPLPVESEPEEEGTALDLRPDGRIGIHFTDDFELVLRRPTLGEFRRFRTALTESNEATVRLRAKHRREQEAEGDEMEEEDKAARRVQRAAELDEFAEVGSIAWWDDVIGTLSTDEPPPSDDWPPFLIYGEQVIVKLLQHWRAVPLAPGVRSNQISPRAQPTVVSES